MTRIPRWLPPMLGFLTAVGPLSTDMYLPSFPAIEATYHAAQGTAQITLASWFAGLAIGQITQGTLSDRFGRRGPLMAGLILYTLASGGCALAPSLPVLVVMRFIAAFGGSASMVLPRAVVRDLADGHSAARMMSQLMLVMGVAPILAPTLGGALLGIANWQSIFWFAAVHGVISTLLVWRLLPETLTPRRRIRLGLAGALSRYGTVARERTFLLHALIGGFAMFSLFAYLSGSSPVYIQIYHLTPAAFGVAFGLCAAGYIGGAQINPLVLRRLGQSLVLRWSVRLYFVSNIVLAGCIYAGVFGVAGVFVPIFLGMTCMGFVSPNSTVGALSRHAAHAGSASALMGTLQFLLAAVSGSLVGLLSDGTARPMVALMLLGSGAAVMADWLRTRGAAPPPPRIAPALPPDARPYGSPAPAP